MRHEHAPRALVELMQIGKTPSCIDAVFQYAPKAFHGIEVMSTTGRQDMQPKLLAPMGQRRRQLMGPMDATAVDHHDDFLPGVAKEGHYLMDIVAKSLRIKLGDDLIKDFRGAILDRANHTEQHATGDATPTPLASPRLAFEVLFASDLAMAQRPCGQAIALGFAVPPACPGEGNTPEDGFIFIQQNDLAAMGLIL
jgi:hypothetical protein